MSSTDPKPGRIDVHTTETRLTGAAGIFESLLRKFKGVTHLLSMIPVYAFFCLLLGTALTPGVLLFQWVLQWSEPFSMVLRALCLGTGLAVAYLFYGLSLVGLVSVVNSVFRLRLSPWKGPYYSAATLKWFLHNGLAYLVRFTFLEMITPSPVALMYFRWMGMKIGRGCQINTSWISDPSLIELGDHVTVGGSVTLVAHYGQGGLLVIAPVKIGNNVTLGIKATVMGGAVLGDGCKLLPHSVVLPKTVIPPGETWGGVPAMKVTLRPQAVEVNSKGA